MGQLVISHRPGTIRHVVVLIEGEAPGVGASG